MMVVLNRYLKSKVSDDFKFRISKEEIFKLVYDMKVPADIERKVIRSIYMLMADSYFCGALDSMLYTNVKPDSIYHINVCETAEQFSNELEENRMILIYDEYCKYKKIMMK